MAAFGSSDAPQSTRRGLEVSDYGAPLKKNPQPRPRVQVWEETKGISEE
jgi:hypothetical protein